MIKLQNVSKYYNTNGVVALGLRKVDLELHRNEFVAIVGESGSGKTTLLNVISGIDSYEDGEMYINGKETSYFSVEDMEDYRKNYVAFVFQNYNLIDSYTVLQNVEAPLILSGYPKDKIRTRAKEIIKKVGLEEHINHKATKLSGGQKQRVVIARALAKDCPVIAADEPTGNLDSKSAKGVIKLLHEISKEKLVIIVTHDFKQVEKYATRKIRVYDGEIVEDLELKKTDKLDLPEIDSKENKIRFRSFLGISLRNLLAVPKKTLLMLIVFTFFSFFVALTYGSYASAQAESNMSINSVFTNSSPNRVVLRNDDNSAFTQDQLNDIADTSNRIIEVVDFDYVLDTALYLEYDGVGDERGAGLNGLFMPISLIEEEDLLYGRLPESDDEIVVSLDTYDIDYYEYYLNKVFHSYSYIGIEYDLEYKVVGIVEQENLPLNPNSYFSCIMGTDSNFEKLKDLFYLENTLEANITFIDTTNEPDLQFTSKGLVGSEFVIDDSLSNDVIKTSTSGYYGNCASTSCAFSGEITIKDNYKSDEYTNNFEITYIVDSRIQQDNKIIFYVNQATYDKIFYDEIYQVSVITSNDIGIDTLISNLQGTILSPSGYHVIYPFDSEASEDFMALIYLILNIWMVILNVIVLLGSTFITYAIFRSIINTKLPDYAIFRTIGANKTAIKRFIYIENFYIVFLSFIIFVVASVAIPEKAVQYTVLANLKVYSFWNYVVFLGLLILMAVMISRRYCNKIFKNTVQTTLKGNMG